MNANTYEVIEDNGGGLHLFIFGGKTVKFAFTNFEYNSGALAACLDELDGGATESDIAGWEGQVENPQAVYDELTGYEFGWQLVACNTGAGRELYPDAMGAAATLELVDMQGGQS